MTWSAHSSVALMNLSHARLLAHEFDAVVTLEDPGQVDGLRLSPDGANRQLVVQFSDTDSEKPPTEEDVRAILDFARAKPGSLLIHCNHGISRSPAVALAVLADRLGPGHERDAIARVLVEQPLAIPNERFVHLADHVLGRKGVLRTVTLSIGRDVRRENVSASGDYISASVCQIVPAPIHAVFPFVTDVTNDPKWISVIVESRQLDQGAIGVGTQFAQTVVGPMGRIHITWQVIDFRKNRRLLGVNLRDDYEFTGGYNFEADGGRTAVTKFATFARLGVLRLVPRSLGDTLLREHFDMWLRRLAALKWE